MQARDRYSARRRSFDHQAGPVTLLSLLKQRGYGTAVVGKWHLGLGNGAVDWNQDIKPGPQDIGFDYSFPPRPPVLPAFFVENRRVVNGDPADPIQISDKAPFPVEAAGKASPELLKMNPNHGHDIASVNGVSRIGYMRGGKIRAPVVKLCGHKPAGQF